MRQVRDVCLGGVVCLPPRPLESCVPFAGAGKNHHFPIAGKHRHRSEASAIFWRLISNTVFLKSHDAITLSLHANK